MNYLLSDEQRKELINYISNCKTDTPIGIAYNIINMIANLKSEPTKDEEQTPPSPAQPESAPLEG